MIACFLVPAFGIVCERARKAELVAKPLALTGEDGALQIVSEEAELYGIRPAQSASAARALCPSIALIPYDGERYTEAARVIWDLLAIESSVVEPVSPELCYVEMSGRDIPNRARSVALEIARQVSCPVQAGIASSKLVARQAALRSPGMHVAGPINDPSHEACGRARSARDAEPIGEQPRLQVTGPINGQTSPTRSTVLRESSASRPKAGECAPRSGESAEGRTLGWREAPCLPGRLSAKQGQASPVPPDCDPLTVEPGKEAEFLADLTLDRLPGLDRALLRRLERLGIRTLGDVARIKPHELHRQCRQSGYLLRRLAMGEDGDAVRAAWPPRALEETLRFEVEICEEAVLVELLRVCTERIAERLPKEGDFCRLLVLDVLLENETVSRSEERLKEPLSSAADLLRAAVRQLQRLQLKQGALAVRVAAGGLGGGSGLQLILLDEFGNGFLRERQQRLEAALAALAKRYGEPAVVRGSTLRPQRRIDLWICALTRIANEPVEVAVNAHGVPTYFIRRGKRYEVEAVQDRWKESDWFGGKVTDRTAYRLVAGAGLYDLHRIGRDWSMVAMAD